MSVGIEGLASRRACCFQLKNSRCNCEGYVADEFGFLCQCGHKPSLHRPHVIDGALSGTLLQPRPWKGTNEGFVSIADRTLLAKLQAFLDSSHKKEDNWTRDRGCSLHGVGHPDCTLSCAAKHRVPVPTSYKMIGAYQNQNVELWNKYCQTKTAIAEECSCMPGAHLRVTPVSAFDDDLQAHCNEWRLFHGSSVGACKEICHQNFRLALSGTGATWKGATGSKGSPLYGFGIYLSESITKADEYSKPAPKEELPPGLDGKEVYCSLILRCVGGRTNVVTTNEIDKDMLLERVFDGPEHSVLGDRVASLRKPYREFVVYDKDQVFPEYLVLYERCYD